MGHVYVLVYKGSRLVVVDLANTAELLCVKHM